MKRFFLYTVLLAGAFACKQKDYSKFTNDPLLYCKTVKQLNDVVLTNNFSPVVASRNYAYANIAAYECIAAGDSNYASLSGQINHLPKMPTPQAGKPVNYQLAAMLAFVKLETLLRFLKACLWIIGSS